MWSADWWPSPVRRRWPIEDPPLKDVEPRDWSGTDGSRKVARNALYNSAAWAGSVLIAILVTPYLVRKLGIEGYGVYALLTSLVGYFSLMDLGLGQGVTKYVAEYVARGDHEAVAASVGAALWVQCVLGVLAAGVLVLCADPLLHVLERETGRLSPP